MTARDFFQTQSLFEAMTPDLQNLVLQTLEGVESDPRLTVATLSSVAKKFPSDSNKRLYIMGMLAGFAASDSRFKWSRE